MKKIVITGASTYGVKNTGDDAMLATLVQGLHQRLPGCELTFLARHPDAKYDEVFGFRSIKNFDHDNKEASRGRFFWGMNRDDPAAHLVAIKDAVESADLLVLGGNSFMEIAQNSFLHGVSSYAAQLGVLARFCDTPFMLYGLNIVEDIMDDVTRQQAKFLCQNARAVTVREESTKQFLIDAGVSDDNFTVLGDPAYGIQPKYSREEAESFLARESISIPPGPVIGVNFRHQYWRDDERQLYTTIEKLAGILDRVTERVGVSILFIPNCTYRESNPWQDDRRVHDEVIKRMSNTEKVFAIRQDFTVFETFAVFQLLDMHISNRRHSSIFAVLHSLPFLAFDSPLKGHMGPFLDDLNVPEQLIDFKEDADLILEKLVETWTSRERISKILHAAIPALRTRTECHIEVVLKCLP